MSEEHKHDHGACCGGHDQEPPKAARVLNADVKANSQTTLRVAGMDCPDEIAAIERALKPLTGVGEVKVNLMAGTATIAHETSVTPEQLIKAIGTAGLKASPMTEEHGDEDEHDHSASRSRLISVVVSGVFTGISLLFQWQNLLAPYGKIVAALVAILASVWLILPKAIRALRHFSLDMNVLMSVAVIGAAAIGEWTEAAAVVFLFALSELLEGFSVGRARRAIQSLLELTPETALAKRGDQIQEVRVEEVKVDETLIVKSGARVPLDGVVTSGESAINQAPITGESMPVEKKSGDTVFAGTINGEGSLEVKVTKASTDTTLAQIIKLVGEAQGQKAPSQRFVDRFAKIYTPVVFLVAILVLLSGPLLFNGAWLEWTYRALVLLVIACPCALVISTPVSIVSGLTAMARRGVLIKGGVFLEEIGKLKALAVDKTGTITEGKPRVQQVIPWNGKSPEEILRVAAAIDTHSEHPLAQAVVKYAEEKKIQFPRSENYQSKTGRGAEAQLDGHLYFVGNHRFAHESAVCSDELEKKLAELEAQAMSVVIVGHKPHQDCKGEVLGILAVADTVRANAAQAIKALHAAGVEKVVMLSGDNQRTVDAISRQVGIDEARGDLLPDQKIERVRELLTQHKHVGMIGDGVNDAPAMATASIGIAMGGVGTDTAIETADIALMQDDLSKVAEAVQLGRRTVGMIQTNIGFALGVKAIFLALAVTGHATLWMAILADTGATLIVIANALRLLRVTEPPATTEL
jgi:Zn2+/Cd2+-exporting ATPase